MARISTQVGEKALERLQNVVESFVNSLGNLGVIVGIEIPGADRVYLKAGYTDLSRTVPVTSDGLFRIASQTKTVVAMTMLVLERQGMLSLEDSASRYLDFDIDPRITLRHLCMNTSGLGEYSRAVQLERYDPKIAYEPRELIAMAKPQGMLFEPGSRFDYCNTGFVVAAMIIERVTGQRYGDALKKYILDPLGLRNTWFGGGAPQLRMLRGYISTPMYDQPLDDSAFVMGPIGSGDGVSSLDDMIALFLSLTNGNGALGISLEDLNKITAKPSPNPHFALSIGTEYGLGIERRHWAGREVWGHPGSSFSYLTSTWLDPELRIVVSTCVTQVASMTQRATAHLRYPREQLFAMTLNTAYLIAEEIERSH